MKSVRSNLGVLLFLVLLFVSVRDSIAQYRDYSGWGMGPGMMGWGYGGGWIGSLFMMLFWVLIIILIAFLIRWILSSRPVGNPNQSREESPLDILKKRYVRGEIDKEEFESKKRDLDLP